MENIYCIFIDCSKDFVIRFYLLRKYFSNLSCLRSQNGTGQNSFSTAYLRQNLFLDYEDVYTSNLDNYVGNFYMQT